MTTSASHPTGRSLLADPLLNHGTAFTRVERDALELNGLLPYDVETVDEQLDRVRDKFNAAESDIDKHILLRAQQDSNETLFYAFIQRNLAEMLPLVYTPTVGEACQHFSHIYRHPRGLFLSYADVDRLDEILAAVDQDVRAIVVTDGERILGLGDQGIGGMGIPVGKLSLYTACAGINPASTLPIILDVGTNNPELLADPLYMGWRHNRLAEQDYTTFTDAFVTAVKRRFPAALLQWEDFAMPHAAPLLERHRDSICSFNDDIQGTAAVVLAALRGATRAAGTRLVDQRFVFVGAGSAGTGIATMLADAIAADGATNPKSQIFMVDNVGLLHANRTGLTAAQQAFATPQAAIADWPIGPLDLAHVVDNAKPTVLVGVSGQPGLFTPRIVSTMLEWTDRPIVFPLSNPTSRAEATPVDILDWSDGRALIATGSPYDPVERNGELHAIAQANNVYIFPGLALGALAARASKVTDSMLHAAAAAVASSAGPDAFLPPLDDIIAVSRSVATAVARDAIDCGAAPPSDTPVETLVDELVWTPTYTQSSADTSDVRKQS